MALYDTGGGTGGGAGGTQGGPPKKSSEAQEQALERMASQLSQASGAGATAKDPFVYVGGGPIIKGAPNLPPVTASGVTTTGKGIGLMTASQLMGQYYTWDVKTKDKFLAHAELAGYDTRNMKDGQLAALWGQYVQQAAAYYAQGRTITPWDIMAKDGAQREAYLRTPRTVTQKSTQYDLSTEGDARAIFYTAAQQLLGRDPTKSEVSSFQKALNKMERANPTITTTTSNYIGDTLQSQSSTTEGGVKEGARQMQAMDEAKAKPEYGAYQAATTYFDAMMEMLGGMS